MPVIISTNTAATIASNNLSASNAMLQEVAFTGAISGTTLTVTSVASSVALGVGSLVTGPGVAPNTLITVGSGSVGTYTVSVPQTVHSTVLSTPRTWAVTPFQKTPLYAAAGVRAARTRPGTSGNEVCSGRGLCDRVAGACTCIAGYTGDACQRTSCPNDCSGNGICQSQSYFVSDVAAATGSADYAYSGFDADSAYGCKCDSGFRGADCSQRECPSGPDPMKGDGGAEGMDCSGRGLCDYTKGSCACFKGFFGERCEELSTLV